MQMDGKLLVAPRWRLTMQTGMLGLAAIFALVMLALAIAGGVHAYSPVPFWDMWDGYIQFYLRLADGDHAAWWSQHNEHRILLSQCLFWLDLAWFGGQGWFLIVSNYLLVAAAAWLFWCILRSTTGSAQPSAGETSLGLFICAWLFLWCQNENFTWGFQSQFILAQLLPLCAFYWQHKSVGQPDRPSPFILACLFGFAAMFSMANGILVLPLMVVLALLARQGWMRTIILLALAVAGSALFFHGYTTQHDHASLQQVLLQDPLRALRFAMRYLGTPFYFLGGERGGARYLALLGGIVLTVCCLRLVKPAVRDRSDTLRLALLVYVLYLAGTALGTAGGRLFLGSDQVFSSRYSTPALMAWATVMILYARPLLALLDRRPRAAGLCLLLLAVPMLVLQWKALAPQQEMRNARGVSGLALELGVHDKAQLVSVYPDPYRVQNLAEQARRRQLSIFGRAPLQGLRDQLGSRVESALPSCVGALESVSAVAGDPQYLRVRGWLAAAAVQQAAPVLMLDHESRLVGAALYREQRAAPAHPPGKRSYFDGYLRADNAGKPITLHIAEKCQLSLGLPMHAGDGAAVAAQQ